MEATKACSRCGTVKPHWDFHRDGAAPDGRRGICRPCRSQHGRTYWGDLPFATRRDRKLRTKYGISLEAFEELIRLQNGACAICKTTKPGGRHNQWHVDHDHVTGHVRGVLCAACNRLLGVVSDNVPMLRAMVDYLEEPPMGSLTMRQHSPCPTGAR